MRGNPVPPASLTDSNTISKATAEISTPAPKAMMAPSVRLPTFTDNPITPPRSSDEQATKPHKNALSMLSMMTVQWAESKTVPDELRQDLHVIYETSPVIRSVLMVNASIPAEAQDAIATVLEQMEQTPEGREVIRGQQSALADVEKV